MNSFVIFPSEISQGATGKVILTGARAHFAFDQHEFRAGIEVRASVLGQGRGRAVVRSASSDCVELEITELHSQRPASIPLHLVVALPRPQTLKKVLEISASFGVLSLHFIRSEGVVKSYFDSPVLQEMESHLIKGLEQVYDYQPPQVAVVNRFRTFLDDTLPILLESVPPARRFLAHTRGGQSALEMGLKDKLNTSSILAIGPESGWNDFEVQCMQKLDFQVLTLGERAYRVEHALCAALGRLAC